MIDFEQEIETRLTRFQHLTGKGNVKDGNRTLYEIVRLMLGMITSTQNAAPPAIPFPKPVEDAEPVLMAEAAPVVVPPDSDHVAITPEVLQHPAQVMSIDSMPPAARPPVDVDAPYGYTRAGHVRTVAPLYGVTPSGKVRPAPRPNRTR